MFPQTPIFLFGRSLGLKTSDYPVEINCVLVLGQSGCVVILASDQSIHTFASYVFAVFLQSIHAYPGNTGTYPQFSCKHSTHLATNAQPNFVINFLEGPTYKDNIQKLTVV